MKLAAPLALCLAIAGCAGPSAQVKDSQTPRTDLPQIDRAILTIEAAELRGDVAELRKGFAAQWEAKPTSPAARFLALYSRVRDEGTWAEFKAMSAESRDSALGWLGQARIYVSWKVWDQIDKVVDAGFEADPDDWLLVIPRALAAEGQGKYDAAAADWTMVLKVDPKNPQALAGRARQARRAKDAVGARSAAEAALVSFPGYLPALLTMADIATDAGDKEEAVRWISKAVEASPRDREMRMTLAKLLMDKGDAAGARDQFKAVLGLKEDADTLALYAGAARAAGDAKGEEAAIERLSAVDPGAAEWKRVAEIRLANGDAAGAEVALRRSLTRDPKDAAAQAAIGRLLEKKGDLHAAMEAYRNAGGAGTADRAALEQRINVVSLKEASVGALQKKASDLIEKTYRSRLGEWPNLAGTLKIRVTTDANGIATLVEVLADSVEDPAVRACAYWNLRDAAYPSKKPGRFTFAFTLRPPR
jgi:Tfp pilus assembly protein PilF